MDGHGYCLSARRARHANPQVEMFLRCRPRRRPRGNARVCGLLVSGPRPGAAPLPAFSPGSPAGLPRPRPVDPDIDIYDYRDVHYAMATRVNPSKDLLVIPNARAFPFDPSAEVMKATFPDTERTRFPCVVGKLGIDATKPVQPSAESRARPAGRR